MTKLELIFSIKHLIEGQTPTQDSSKFTHPQLIEAEVAKAYEHLVIQFFSDPEMFANYDLDYFCKTYNERLLKSTSGELYTSLPAKPIPLMHGLGVRMVRPQNSHVMVNRITESEFMTLRNMEAFCCSPIPFCYVDNSGGKIVFQANRKEYEIMDYITIKIIPRFGEMTDDDEINSPMGDYALSQMVIQAMQYRPTDDTNDGGK